LNHHTVSGPLIVTGGGGGGGGGPTQKVAAAGDSLLIKILIQMSKLQFGHTVTLPWMRESETTDTEEVSNGSVDENVTD
jgi:hypothetical protein